MADRNWLTQASGTPATLIPPGSGVTSSSDELWVCRVTELHALEAKQYVDPMTFAEVHATLGEMDEALHWYEKAPEDRSPNLVYALVASRIIPQLAGNPGYQAIIHRMAYPQPGE
jgi:hypothetical protein